MICDEDFLYLNLSIIKIRSIHYGISSPCCMRISRKKRSREHLKLDKRSNSANTMLRFSVRYLAAEAQTGVVRQMLRC